MTSWQLCFCLIRSNPYHIGLLVATNLVAVALLPVVLGFQMKWFFDSLTSTQPELREALWVVAGMFGVVAVRAGFFLLRTFSQVTNEYILATIVWQSILENILRELGARALPDSIGDALNRMKDDSIAIARFFVDSAFAVSAMFVALVSLAVMCAINPTIAAVTILPVILLGLALTSLKPQLQQSASRERVASARVTGLIGDMFGIIETIQVGRAEGRFLGELRKWNLERQNAAVLDRTLNGFIAVGASAVSAVGTGAAMIAASNAMQRGAFSIGQFALFTHLVIYVGEGIAALATMVASYKRLPVHVNRLEELLTNEAGMALVASPAPVLRGPKLTRRPQAPAPPPAAELSRLTVNGLTYAYPGSGRGIQDISFEMDQGTLTVVAGPAGSGKSTLLRCFLGQLPIQRGEIFWNADRIHAPQRFFQPPVCAASPQLPRLFSASLRENVLLGEPYCEPAFQCAITKAVLEEDIQQLEHGLDTQIGPRGAKLSGGQIQRVAAARMLLRPAQLYVFDDLTRGLDIETEKSFWQRLLGGRATASYLVVSNSRAALEKADTILVMGAGRVVARGNLRELSRNGAAPTDLW